jgi:acylglycerol lipase
MPHHDAQFAGYDGLGLFQQCWLPESESAAVVAVVHGVNEHSGRYARLAESLNQRGYAVYAMDLRVHGKSAGPRAEIRRFDEYLKDVALFLQNIAQREPGKPLFLLGHSMGGAVAALLCIRQRPQLRGLVLSAPAVLVGGRVFPLLRHLASLFSHLAPRLRLVRIGCHFISRDPEIVAAFKNDPLVFHGRFPVRTGAEILRAAKQIQAHMQDLELPVLILHGTGDFVTDCEGSRRLHLGIGSRDKTLYLYEGLYHEVLSEPEREKVLGDLLAWLDARR